MESAGSRRGGSQMTIAIIAVVCIAVAAALIIQRAKKGPEETEGEAFYYCEDCGYEFTASSKLIPPIKCPKTGKLAGVEAVKFKGKDGKVFTGYYEKFDPEVKRLIEARERGEQVDDAKIGNILVRTRDGDWVDSGSPEGEEIYDTITSPTDGSTGNDLQRVYPQRKK